MLRTRELGDTGGEPSLSVLQVGTLDEGGGAASVSRSLSRGLRARGQQAWLAVGRQGGDDPHVFLLPDDNRAGYRLSGYAALQRGLRKRAGASPGHGWGFLSRSLRLATHPGALAAELDGIEDFEFPGTFELLKLAPDRPDVVHCHNLHGGFFDLRALAWLSHELPTALTLHDSWLLTGHCAHSFDCDRWTTGCGSCPDLSIYPAIRRDATARNWYRKREIYSASRLYVTAPSSWLMDRVWRSMLAPAVAMSRVIPNGVDLSVFRPGVRNDARRALGLPADRPIVLAMSGRHDRPWLDDETMSAALDRIADAKRSSIVLAPGGGMLLTRAGGARIVSVPPVSDPRRMALHYQAADLYLHCARAATAPVSILESLACATPVVASAVGGIVEQIRPLDSAEEPTGVLVPEKDGAGLARAVITLLDDEELRRRMGGNAVRDARGRFDRETQVGAYLDWYRTIIEHWNAHARHDQ